MPKHHNEPLARSTPIRRGARGFTLIEVMITVAIIAILSSLAYPSYRDYVTRARLTDAVTGLTSMRANMERYFQDNRTYLDAGTFTSPCNATTGINTKYFTMSCSASTATTYTLQAQGVGAMSSFRLTLDSTNAQSQPQSAAGWNSNNCTTIWVLQKNQPCS